MSLLLDALKKAAEDKKKHEQQSGSENTAGDVGGLKSEEQVLEILPEPELPAEIEDSTDTMTGSEPVADELLVENELPPVDDSLELDLDMAEAEKLSEDTVSEEDELADFSKPRQTGTPPEVKSEDSKLSTEKDLEPAPVENLEIQTQQPEPVPEKPEAPPVVPPAAARRQFQYSHEDATKIIQVATQRYNYNRRLSLYITSAFVALLFFFITYVYYSTQSLDNTRPVPRVSHQTPQAGASIIQRTSEDQADVTNSAATTASIESPQKAESAATTTTGAKTSAVRKPAPISIVKSQKEDPVAVLLTNAYSQYQQANYKNAESLYQKVLQKDKNQRDALLGLAAVATIENQHDKAKFYYQRLLKLNPKDDIANAALVDLEKKSLAVADESKLKLLLQETPEAAHVYFSLGLLYAKQQRWPEAQAQFFEAYSRDKNGDYAFNLAVALDQLGKSKAALNYYQQAISYAEKHHVSFDEKAALNRVEKIEAANE